MAYTPIFYSGVEAEYHFRILAEAAGRRKQHILISYWHLKTRDRDALRKRKEEFPDMDIIIDSGAYSFLAGKQEEAKSASMDRIKKYLDEYAEFLYRNRDYIFAAVEFDIEDEVGYEQVRKWEDEYFSPLEKYVPIIYVWHPERGRDEYINMCRRHDYVGLSSTSFAEMESNALMQIARRYLTKIHGFAMTTQYAVGEMGLFSCDSITWKSGEKYGTIFTFMNGEFVRHEAHTVKRFENYIRSRGFNFEAILQNKSREVTKVALDAHMLMEEYYAKQNKNRYYEFKLPVPDEIENYSDKEIIKWADKLSGIVDVNNKQRLQILSALQRGKWDFLEKEDKAIVNEIICSTVGDEIKDSFEEIDNRDHLRTRICLRCIPPAKIPLKRMREEDFEPNFSIKKRL